MPFQLPPLRPPVGRRDFLKGLLLASAGLLFGPRLQGAEADPHTWALLSDTHIHAERATVVRGMNMAENLMAVARELLALQSRPAAVLVNGDCALLQGDPGDYTTLGELLEPLRKGQMPIHITLGNHDERETFRAAFPETKGESTLMADRHVGLVRGERANWILLDSLDQTNRSPGELGEMQRSWLATVLDENSDKPAIVVAHHNLEDGRGHGTLKDSPGLMEVLAPRKQVKAYVFGHTHNWNITAHPSGIHLINLPPVAYVFGPGKPSGWVLATVEVGGVRLKLNCLNQGHTQHGEIHELKWR